MATQNKKLTSSVLGPDGKPAVIEPSPKPRMFEFFAYEIVGCTDDDLGDLVREMTHTQLADFYRSKPEEDASGVMYRRPDCTGYTVLAKLPELIGQPFDNLAMAYIHSLRPSRIRVSSGIVTADCMLWRVTVFLNPDNTIRSIVQEVECAYGSGQNLSMILNARKRGQPPPEKTPTTYGNVSGLARAKFD